MNKFLNVFGTFFLYLFRIQENSVTAAIKNQRPFGVNKIFNYNHIIFFKNGKISFAINLRFNSEKS